MTTDIDRRAPVTARAETRSDAQPDEVWRVLTDVAAWPSWNRGVASTDIGGPIAVGTAFRWRAGPATVSSTILAADPPLHLAWSGRTMGITAVHAWTLQADGDGCRITSEESWAGLAPSLLRWPLRIALSRALRQWNEDLTRAVSSSPPPSPPLA